MGRQRATESLHGLGAVYNFLHPVGYNVMHCTVGCAIDVLEYRGPLCLVWSKQMTEKTLQQHISRRSINGLNRVVLI